MPYLILGARPRHSGLLSAVYCLLLLSCCGCSTQFFRGRAERRIARRLTELIGPADRYHVRLRGTRDADIVVGRLRQIEVDGWNVNAGGQITLESLHLVLHDLRFHAPPEEQLTVGESELVIHLTEPALNDYLRRQHPESPPEVSLNGGTVTLHSSLRLLGAMTPLITTGRVEIEDRSRVVFRAQEVRLAADPVPGFGPEYVERHLNPLLNVAQLKLPLRLDDIQVQPGMLIVRGSAYLPPPARAR